MRNKSMIVPLAAILTIGALCTGCTTSMKGADQMIAQENQKDNETNGLAATEADSTIVLSEINESENEEDSSDLLLTDEGKNFLHEMCFYLPEFSQASDLNDTFWHDFLFSSYTGKGGDEYELVEVYREDFEFSEQQIKVNRNEVAEYVRLALGMELPVYEPALTDMEEWQTGFYYQDGYYYIGVSDFGDVNYVWQGMTKLEDQTYLVDYMISGWDEEQLGTVGFLIQPADNANGFIIVGKTNNVQE